MAGAEPGLDVSRDLTSLHSAHSSCSLWSSGGEDRAPRAAASCPCLTRGGDTCHGSPDLVQLKRVWLAGRAPRSTVPEREGQEGCPTLVPCNPREPTSLGAGRGSLRAVRPLLPSLSALELYPLFGGGLESGLGEQLGSSPVPLLTLREGPSLFQGWSPTLSIPSAYIPASFPCIGTRGHQLHLVSREPTLWGRGQGQTE